MVRRVLIKGSSGAGKSTLGRAVSEQLGVPYVELDALHHGPSWTAASARELQERVMAALDDERGWVVDGNYESKLGALVLDRAELILWLDLPLRTKLARLARRTAQRWFRREELWNGNRETLRGAFWGRDALFAWAIRTHFDHRQQWPQDMERRSVLRLRSVQQVDAWLADLGERARAAD